MQRLAARQLLVSLLLAAALSGCTGCPYSFTGASVPPHLKTIAIPIVEDQSGFGDPTLRDQFSQQLQQRFLNDATLQPSDRTNADSMLEGVITGVRDVPVRRCGAEVARAIPARPQNKTAAPFPERPFCRP